MRIFRLIISRACGLFSTMNVLLYRYIWNFSQPYTIAKKFSLNVGIAGLGVREGFAGNTIGCPS